MALANAPGFLAGTRIPFSSLTTSFMPGISVATIVFPFIKVSMMFRANPSNKDDEARKSKLLIHSTISLRYPKNVTES